MTRHDLLTVLYWGKSQIADYTGCSYNTASKVLRTAQERCEADGKMNLYKNKVYHAYVLELLGIQLERKE